jgi:hypothetical protein
VYHDVTDDASVLVGLGDGDLIKPYSRFDQIGTDRDVDGAVTAGSIERIVEDPVLGAETGDRSTVSVFPNPTSEYIIVKVPVGGKVSIYNMNGMLVMSKAVKAGDNKIDISSLPRNVYTIQTKSAKGIECKRLIKR